VGGEIIHVVGWSWEWALEVGGEGRLGVGFGSGNIWGQMSMGFQTKQLGKIAILALLETNKEQYPENVKYFTLVA
jgi:hypothetical protein